SPLDHLRSILACSQCGAELFEEALDSVLLDVAERLAVDSRGASVPSHPLPRLLEDVIPPEMVIQGVETPTRCSLGCSTQPPLQFSHFVARLAAAGVFRSGLAGHSLALTCSVNLTTAGTLPSDRVLLRNHRRYYDPLGLPLHSARLRLCLIRATLPRPGPCRRVSRVPHSSLYACCSPYPAGTRCAFRYWRDGCCLRRDMSGSAPGLFICRGCRLHFMLRPTYWLPVERLTPPHRLLMPRSGARVSPRHLGRASRRTDAYRSGTLTRWRSAASGGRASPRGEKNIRRFTTHHARILPKNIRPGRAKHAPAPHQPAQLSRPARARNPLGLSPNRRRKLREKCEGLLKPQPSAISIRLRQACAGFESSSAARSIRRSQIKRSADWQ